MIKLLKNKDPKMHRFEYSCDIEDCKERVVVRDGDATGFGSFTIYVQVPGVQPKSTVVVHHRVKGDLCATHSKQFTGKIRERCWHKLNGEPIERPTAWLKSKGRRS